MSIRVGKQPVIAPKTPVTEAQQPKPAAKPAGFFSGVSRWLDQTADKVANAVLHLDHGRPTKLGGPLETQDWLKSNYGAWWHESPRNADGSYVADAAPWPHPELFGPGVKGTNVFVHNEKVSAASPDQVMATLRDATHWSQVCDNLADAKIEGGAPRFEPGSKFNWTTFASNMNGEIVELNDQSEPKVIGWRAKDLNTDGKQIDVYHRYLLYSQPGGGTRIVTEESQRGSLTRLMPLVNPNQEKMMLAGHQYLLDCIDAAASK